MFQFHSGGLAQPKFSGVVGQGINPHPLAHLIKINITRLRQCPLQRHSPMPTVLPAAVAAVAKDIVSRTVNHRVLIDNPFGKTRQSGDELIGGGRWIRSLNRLMDKWMAGIVKQVLPFGMGDSADKVLQMERRSRDQGQQTAGLDLHGHHSTGLVCTHHHFFGHSLQITVNGQMNFIAGKWLNTLEELLFKTAGIDF